MNKIICAVLALVLFSNSLSAQDVLWAVKSSRMLQASMEGRELKTKQSAPWAANFFVGGAAGAGASGLGLAALGAINTAVKLRRNGMVVDGDLIRFGAMVSGISGLILGSSGAAPGGLVYGILKDRHPESPASNRLFSMGTGAVSAVLGAASINLLTKDYGGFTLGRVGIWAGTGALSALIATFTVDYLAG